LSGEEFLKLLPFTVVAITALVVLGQVCVRRDDTVAAMLTLLGLALAFGLLFYSDGIDTERVTVLLVLDGYALFFAGLIIAAAGCIVVLSHRYFRGFVSHNEEFYILLLLATVGSLVLVSANHFASLFIGLELLSISLYGLISYPRRQLGNIEAAVKYVILAGASSAFLLFGIALVYMELGTLDFDLLLSRREEIASVREPMVSAGLGLVLVGLGFKLAVVPFHMWAPDVYEGAPLPVTAFIATVSKVAIFALLLRFFRAADYRDFDSIVWAFYAIAAASMLVGNLLALLQRNVVRLLAYSSIAHMGYLLVAFVATGSLVTTAVGFYLTIYVISMLAALGVLTLLSTARSETERVDDLGGLFWSQPALAIILTLSMLSLAGIPFTGGFIAKFFVVAAGAQSSEWLLVVLLVLTSAVGLFYYLRVIGALYTHAAEPAQAVQLPATWMRRAVMGGLGIGVIVFGVYPRPLIDLVETMTNLG